MTTNILAYLIGWLAIIGFFGVLEPRFGFLLLVVGMVVFMLMTGPPIVFVK